MTAPSILGIDGRGLRAPIERSRACRSRAARSSCSRGCATTPATGTTTRKSPPTCSTRSSNTPTSPSIREEVVITADSDELAGVSVPVHDRPQAGSLQRQGARDGCARYVDARRAALLRRLQPRRRRPLRRCRSSRRCARSSPARTRSPSSRRRTRSIAPSSSFPTARRKPRTSSTAGATTSCTTTCAASSTTAALGVLYSNKDYGCEWDYDWRNKRFQRDDNTQFGVNLVVYAMTS